MNNQRKHWRWTIACGYALMLALPSLAQTPSKFPPPGLILDIDCNIYANQEAFNLVMAARKLDPNTSVNKEWDRDAAAKLYAQAIAAQPGAKGNAPLANRIAQMYATFEDRETNVHPDRAASQWWLQCLTLTDDTQLLWAQAQMGLINVGSGDRDQPTATERCQKILAMEPEKLELPRWKDWSGTSAKDAAEEMARERADLVNMQKVAAERIAVLAQNAKDAAAATQRSKPVPAAPAAPPSSMP